jgi:hypothetical protein
MAKGAPVPAAASVFLDARGAERALRVSWHTEADLVVLSMWRENVCVGSFRLAIEEVPDLIGFLSAGLGSAYAGARAAHPA